ncbi:MAG: HlyD family efflux transporter periplasmic adaptor subunit [Ignavibacteriae bacterium]|nr:HlyD family efflux transporter periplasmic adaptor subunit [Ignavibacteriota bacterium]
MKNIIIPLLAISVFIASCTKKDNRSDAYGNFEAVETIVSAEASGKILQFNVEEGQKLEQDAIVGCIDTVQLHLKKLQIAEQKKTVGTKFKSISTQVAVLEEQKRVNLREKARIERLIKDDAATGKQLDDINGVIDVINRQIASVKSQDETTRQEMKGYDAQADQIIDQISKSNIVNPVSGTVVLKLAETSEVVTFGKPLYKIADLSEMELRVYISGAQLPEIKLGQKVKVLIDNGANDFRSLEGVISWISDKAEFTPKIIQTKEERVNLVYAVKVKVKNDGSLKIGMPGEIIFK